MLKVAVIGKGKTGGEILQLLPEANVVGPFDSSHPVTVATLKTADVGIVFVPTNAFSKVAQVLVDSKVPMIIGTTGIDFKNFSPNAPWIYASNFSLGMQLVRAALEQIDKLLKLFPHLKPKIHEVHHTKKQDSPSGTALMWNNLISNQAEITAERTGDVKGYHELTIENDNERIQLTHDAKTRKIFAEGAIWAAQFINQNKHIKPGVYAFNDIIKDFIKDNSHESFTLDGHSYPFN